MGISRPPSPTTTRTPNGEQRRTNRIRRPTGGIEGLWRLVATLAEPWENRFDGSVQLEELQAHGPWVIVPWRGRLHGRGSGVELEVYETCAVLVRAGKIARVEEYRTTEEAVQAVRGRGAAAE